MTVPPASGLRLPPTGSPCLLISAAAVLLVALTACSSSDPSPSSNGPDSRSHGHLPRNLRGGRTNPYRGVLGGPRGREHKNPRRHQRTRIKSQSTTAVLYAILAFLLAGCVETEEVPDPGDEPTAEAEPSDFEELSGAEIPDSAESVEVFSVGDVDSLPTYVATFTLPSEEEASSFCKSGDIGNYRTVYGGELAEEKRERHFIGETELVDPRRCTSVKYGENVDRSAVFSFPEGERVSVWAVTEEVGW